MELYGSSFGVGIILAMLGAVAGINGDSFSVFTILSICVFMFVLGFVIGYWWASHGDES